MEIHCHIGPILKVSSLVKRWAKFTLNDKSHMNRNPAPKLNWFQFFGFIVITFRRLIV